MPITADITAWQDLAACRGADYRIFYPDRGERADDAKQFCRRCPVMAQCRAHGLQKETYGVWGGLTEKERDEVRNELRKNGRADAREAGR